MKVFSLNSLKWGLVIFLTSMLSSCSSKQPVNFNIHTEPEGAHIIYSIDSLEWKYLGVTPLDAVQVMDEKGFKNDQTFTLRAMRCGYVNQSKQWTAERLLEENEEKGMIFWTPRLIKANE